MEVGIYGKLPSHGDFLRRRVPDEFIGVWDAWLQESIAASRIELGTEWLNLYLTSPAWRFYCAAGVCGPDACAGVMAPSVDRVGRYFPLTIVWRVPDDITPFTVARCADHWFDAVERLLVETLGADQVDFDAFDARLCRTTRHENSDIQRPVCEQQSTFNVQFACTVPYHVVPE